MDCIRLVFRLKNWGMTNTHFAEKVDFWWWGRHRARRRRRVKGGMAAAASLVVREAPTVDFIRLVSGLKNW